MSTLNDIENAISMLGREQFAELRRWLDEYEASRWDREFEDDVKSGRLDAFAEEAIREYRAAGGPRISFPNRD